jgi:hypothetical protein
VLASYHYNMVQINNVCVSRFLVPWGLDSCLQFTAVKQTHLLVDYANCFNNRCYEGCSICVGLMQSCKLDCVLSLLFFFIRTHGFVNARLGVRLGNDCITLPCVLPSPHMEAVSLVFETICYKNEIVGGAFKATSIAIVASSMHLNHITGA